MKKLGTKTMNKYFFKIWFYLLLIMAVSCKPSRYLEEGEMLYNDAEINIETPSGFFEKRDIKNKLRSAVEPEPTSKTLGFIRIKPWFYSLYPEDIPEEGFKHWVKYSLGEPPEIYESSFADVTERNFKNLLFNNGYFLNEVEVEKETDDRKVNLIFNVNTRDAFHIDTLIWPDTLGNEMNKLIYENRDQSNLNEGQQYLLENLREERERLNALLKNNGYYYFNPNYLIYKIDTAINGDEHLVDLYLEYPENTPKEATKVWTIDDMYLHMSHEPGNTDSLKGDTVEHENFHLIYDDFYVRPAPITRSMLLEPGEIYKLSSHNYTLNKLMGLGIFQFVNMDFSRDENSDSAYLNGNVYLTRQIPRTIRLELQAVTKSNDYTGPNLKVIYRDRNFIGGAEHFQVNANAGFETQLNTEQEGLNSYELGLESELVFPRFIFPFLKPENWLGKRYMPKSKVSSDNSITKRSRYFSMNSVSLSWGYIWEETRNKQHSLYPLNTNYINLTNRTTLFDSLLQERPLLERSFREQFILGLLYSYQQTTGDEENGTFSTYLNANAELAGNTLSLVNDINTSSDEGEFLGTPFSQFARAQTDIRFYYHMRKSSIAHRLILGIGYPYGNSRTLPYNRQFFIGGTSSIRAFNSRSIGPGTYEPDTMNIYSFEQSGEMKFEANLEYRFDIYKLFNGAFFFDVGNVWLLNEDDEKPGGQFKWNEFYNQLAMGTGFGLRLDISLLVLRFDIGVPIRTPYKSEGERWVIDDLQFNDLVLNIAIGYPF